jgi:hypothetical protein
MLNYAMIKNKPRLLQSFTGLSPASFRQTPEKLRKGLPAGA